MSKKLEDKSLPRRAGAEGRRFVLWGHYVKVFSGEDPCPSAETGGQTRAVQN